MLSTILQDGAWIAGILSGLSIVAGVWVWIAGQLRGWRQRRALRRRRNWHGWIDRASSYSWHVRVVEPDPDEPPSGRVVLEVLDRAGGDPDVGLARTLAGVARADGMLSQVPTPAQAEFLKMLARKHRYGDPEGIQVE